MKLLGALFLVSLAASNLRTCEAAVEVAVQVGRHHTYEIRLHLDQSQTKTEEMDHFNVTLENNELLHQLLSLMNSSWSTCTTAFEPKPNSSSSTGTTAIEPKLDPMDCSDIFDEGQTQSGTYQIFPLRNQPNKSLEVFCDMEDGGGWTVFLLRDKDASEHVNFNRNWNTYKEFFGSADHEYWIGNENLHALTSSNRTYEGRFDAKDVKGDHTWVGYDFFYVASEENGYQLTLEGYQERSTVKEFYGFGVNNGQKFTTSDMDNDGYSGGNCGDWHKAGWWFNSCAVILPTGSHAKEWPQGITMNGWSKENNVLGYPKWLQFKIRPTN